MVSSRSRLEVLEPLLLRGSLPGAARLVTGLDECPVSGVTFALARADVLGAGVGLPAELGVAGSLHLACSPGRAALDAREPVASDDAASDPRFAAAARTLGVGSIVAAPVRVRSVAVGAVFGAAPEGRRLPPGAMSTVASAALALEQALSELHARHAPAEDLRATRADGRAHLHVLRAAGLDLVDSSGSVAVVASRLHGALLSSSKTMGAALEDATLAFAEASGAYHHVRRRLDGLLFEPDEGDVELRDHLRVVLAALVELRPLLLLAEATRSGILPAARAQRAAEALSPVESSNDLERGAAAIAGWVERRCSSAPPPGLSGFPGSSRPSGIADKQLSCIVCAHDARVRGAAMGARLTAPCVPALSPRCSRSRSSASARRRRSPRRTRWGRRAPSRRWQRSLPCWRPAISSRSTATPPTGASSSRNPVPPRRRSRSAGSR